jgi:hypothetical protein
VPRDAATLVDAERQEFILRKAHPFQGPLNDNRGVERVRAGEVFPLGHYAMISG